MENYTKLGVLKTRSEFLHVRSGKYRAFKNLVIQANTNPNSRTIRVGFTATKKIGNAVVRNKAKRRLKHVARELLPEHGLKGVDYVFIARNSTASTPYKNLMSNTRDALASISQTNKKVSKN
ncbi:ribonuclease P protein component [Hellea sp.]|nr:ribonuclease P protein component [Hellea sp.]